VLVLLINLYPMSYLTMRRGEHLLVADAMAQNALEEARAVPYESLLVGSTRTLDPLVRTGITFSGTRRIAEVPGLDPDLCREIVVQVEWTEKNRGIQRVTHRVTRSRVAP